MYMNGTYTVRRTLTDEPHNMLHAVIATACEKHELTC